MGDQQTATGRTVPTRWSIDATSRIEQSVPLSTLTIGLWTTVFAASALDILTTAIGLRLGLSEGNALARGLVETLGTPGLAGLKLAALAVLAVTWYLVDERRGHAALAGFGGVTVIVVVVNIVTITTA
ncbi:DUF5658 family protein [Halorhabdus amylolytica]|uniref:DUF5658 family protein n=1 Tax=Halorhabdus amylolytica TaxID=2559573 RepID=UPI0010AA9259|nr:DUF5658 family protein [Halorhabdus amylolytica]